MAAAATLPLANRVAAQATPGTLEAAVAASAHSVPGSPGVIGPLQLLAPLGISPFLALGLFGAAEYAGYATLPPTLRGIGHPVLWMALLVLAAVFKLGRSNKFTKPIVEAAGTGESLISLVLMAGVLLVPAAAAGQPAPRVVQAGMFGAGVTVLAVLGGLFLVLVLRTALDVLTWLSPIPLIDAFLQVIKTAATLVLVVLAVFFPKVALAAALVSLVAAVVLARWLLRVARFAGVILWDAVVGQFWPVTRTGGAEWVGHAPGYVVLGGRVHGLRRWQRVEVFCHADGGWFIAAPAGKKTALGSGGQVQATRSFAGTRLTLPGVEVLTLASYAHPVREMVAASGARYTREGRRGAAAPIPVI